MKGIPIVKVVCWACVLAMKGGGRMYAGVNPC